MFETIKESDIKSRAVANLSTTPTRHTPFGESGLTADELKKRFDELPRYIAERLNEIFETISTGKLAEAMKTPKGKSVGVEFDSLLNGEVDMYVKTDDGQKKELSLLCRYALEMYSGLATGVLADDIQIKGEELEALNAVIAAIRKTLAEQGTTLDGFAKDAEEWERFWGGNYTDYYTPSMKILDEAEKNNRYFDFDGKYNRVYTHLSGGRGPYGRYCLTEAPVAPQDPDGTAFEHGKGVYFVASGQRFIYISTVEYTISHYPGRLDINSALKPYCTIGMETGDDNITRVHLEIDKTAAGAGIITYYNTAATRRKCIFETDMYVDLSDAVYTEKTAGEANVWFLRIGFISSSGDVWNDSPVRLCYHRSSGEVRAYGSDIAIPEKQWFNLRVEQIGRKIEVIYNGILLASRTDEETTDFHGVKFELRSSTYVYGVKLRVQNSCVHTSNENTFSVATLDSIPQRTNLGFLLVPTFDLGEEPTETDRGGEDSHIDEIAVPLSYVKSMQSEILAGLDRVIAAQEKILGGDV